MDPIETQIADNDQVQYNQIHEVSIKIDKLLEHIDSINERMNDITKRLDTLETIDIAIKEVNEKTEDIHQYVPFVGWLESIKNKLPILRLYNNTQQPLLLETDLKD